MNAAVAAPAPLTGLKRFLAFSGPGLLVAVGYMDPGNWATDLKGGSKYGYALLWVILASNLMAILLQTLCVRLGLATGLDLAQVCRAAYKRPASIALWILAELAIIATDVAEVIGSAVALGLLFGIPLQVGVLITGLDVLLILALGRFGFRKIEAVIGALVLTIFGCFLVNIIWARPDWGGVAGGLFRPSLPDAEALAISVGILGATVMPHNLYLHSSIVKTRAQGDTDPQKADAIRGATRDTVVSLGLAFFVNAAILVLAAAVFHRQGRVVEELEEAHRLLTPALGGAAATLFAVALLASGQSSTVTGTMAGQIVMEGFVDLKVAPWLRRLITRGLAIIPAMIFVTAGGGKGTVDLLVLSQVLLSMQLPFAVIPLVLETSRRSRMGAFASPLWMTGLASVTALIICGLNVALLKDLYGWVVVGTGVLVIALFALWVTLRPGRAK